MPELERTLGLQDGYRIEEMQVEGTDGNRYVAQAYVARPDHFDRSVRPTPGYRDELVAAARGYGFPRVYVGFIAAARSTADP